MQEISVSRGRYADTCVVVFHDCELSGFWWQTVGQGACIERQAQAQAVKIHRHPQQAACVDRNHLPHRPREVMNLHHLPLFAGHYDETMSSSDAGSFDEVVAKEHVTHQVGCIHAKLERSVP